MCYTTGKSNPYACGRSGDAEAIMGAVTRLTEHVAVFAGSIHVGVVIEGDAALLIDCVEEAATQAAKLGVARVEQVLFTHHHRDQVGGALELAASGARLVAPESERAYFTNPEAYWNDPKSRWHLYDQHPHHLMVVEPLPIAGTVKGGEVLTWGPVRIEVLTTPGHTDGAVSYLVEADGKRVVFCGDVIYDHGQVWELFSLQKGTETTDYHGFLGSRDELFASLARIRDARPDLLVPSHGQVMAEPAAAMDALGQRLRRCYDKYVAISALRHYFPALFAEFADRRDHMPIRSSQPVPNCLRHFGTTWVLISEDKSALVMDCGNTGVIDELKGLLDRGEIRSVDALWVTHYHDDHVHALPEFQQAFDCPCVTDASVARIISDPLAWRLPCISPNAARVDRVTSNGESWRWREFELTAYHFPGQTLYHSGLLAVGRGLRLFFVGDSFTRAGIDDYCAQNRNWLGAGVGFNRCLDLLEAAQPTHLFNCHVDEPFVFTADDYAFMRANLAERERLFGDLVPWDHANYGMDESWVRSHPYEQRVGRGRVVRVDVVFTNHSPAPKRAGSRLVVPRAWRESTATASLPWRETTVAGKSEGSVSLTCAVPQNAGAGRYVIPVDVRYDARALPVWTETIVVVE